jgi:pimeloyl-ACP methyl ester carboxylesterase
VSKQSFITCLFAALLGGCAWRGQRLHHISLPAPIEPRLHQVSEPTVIGQPDVLILGFMGGRDSWDDARPGVGRLAKKLREMDLPGVQVATIENRKRPVALELVRRAFDRNRGGELDWRERESVRLILYGQSFGGAAVVKFARELKTLDIPVMLTVQVDSIGRNDEVIPSNVAAAANLFQRDGVFVHGRAPIRAEDPRKTEIIGNFQFSYRDRAIHLSGVPWHKKIFRIAHTRMDLDPAVWGKVEELILLALRPDLPEH